MKEVVIAGLDLAKNAFQLQGVSSTGAIIFRKQLGRAQVLSFFEALPASL